MKKVIHTFTVLNSQNWTSSPLLGLAYSGTEGNDFVISLDRGIAIAMGDGDDVAINISQGGIDVYLDGGNDVALGRMQGNNQFFGGFGDDFLAVSGGDNNYLDGGPGADILFGGKGNDTIVFDAADKLVVGGKGSDHFMLNPYAANGVARIADFDASSSNHDVLDLSMFSGGLTRSDIYVFDYNNGEQRIYIAGSEQSVALIGVNFVNGIDQAIADGILVLSSSKG